MPRIMLKSKIHRVRVTGADLDYMGSISIDARLMEAACIAAYEQVSIYNITNGERFETYAIPAARNSGEVCINGAAAHRAQRGDLIIIACYVVINEDKVAGFKPKIILVDEQNRIK